MDPVGGSSAIERLTDEIEQGAEALIEQIDRAGGMLSAIERGTVQRQIQESAYRDQQAIERGERVVVGVNRYQADEPNRIALLRIDPESERRQADAVRELRRTRDASAWQAAMTGVEHAARNGSNLVPPIVTAVLARATLGEIADALRRVFGEHREFQT